MTDRVKEGLSGLCFAAVAGIVGAILTGVSHDLAGFFFFVALLIAITSLAVIGIDLARKSPAE